MLGVDAAQVQLTSHVTEQWLWREHCKGGRVSSKVRNFDDNSARMALATRGGSWLEVDEEVRRGDSDRYP